MPLVDLFTYTPYGPSRYYTVVEARQGVTLSQFALPRPVEQVMEWAGNSLPPWAISTARG